MLEEDEPHHASLGVRDDDRRPTILRLFPELHH